MRLRCLRIPRGLIFPCCCSLSVNSLPLFSIFVVLVNRPDAMKLGTRRTSTLLACKDLGALRLSACRFPITALLRDTPSPLDCFSFATHRTPVLVHYYRTSYFGFRCVFFFCTPWPGCALAPCRNDVVLPVSRVFFLVLFCLFFFASRGFAPAARRVSRATLRFC